MAKKRKTTRERGLFKQKIHAALYKNADIRDMLLGDTSSLTSKEVMKQFKKHVKSHLFIDEIVVDADIFIYYDVVMPSLHSNYKECKILLYAICHRDHIDDEYIKDGYYGNRVDVLTEFIEDALLDESVINTFGIGELELDSIEVYNATRFYGSVMTFSVPNFR